MISLNLSVKSFVLGVFAVLAVQYATAQMERLTTAETVAPHTWILAGQSNGYNMEAVPGSAGGHSDTRIFLNGEWRRPRGAGTVALLNGLRRCSGVPQRAVMTAAPGSSLTREGIVAMIDHGVGVYVDFWLNEHGSIWTNAVQTLKAATKGDAIGVIFQQGESDTMGVAPEVYASALEDLQRNFAEQLPHRPVTPLPFYVVELGDYAVWNDANPGRVREGQKLFAARSAGGAIGAEARDLPYDKTGGHLTPDALAEVGRRLAKTICRDFYHLPI